MSNVSWERRHEALKAIHDKIAEALERVLQTKGTPTRTSVAASGEIVAAPGAGNKLQVYGWFLKVDTDENVTLRYGGATGQVFAGLPTKGVAGMNLLGIDESGGDNENVWLEKSGTGNVDVVVWTEVV